MAEWYNYALRERKKYFRWIVRCSVLGIIIGLVIGYLANVNVWVFSSALLFFTGIVGFVLYVLVVLEFIFCRNIAPRQVALLVILYECGIVAGNVITKLTLG